MKSCTEPAAASGSTSSAEVKTPVVTGSQAPVQSIGHLVKRKRKPDEDSTTEVKRIKTVVELLPVGSSVALPQSNIFQPEEVDGLAVSKKYMVTSRVPSNAADTTVSESGAILTKFTSRSSQQPQATVTGSQTADNSVGSTTKINGDSCHVHSASGNEEQQMDTTSSIAS